MVESLSAWQVYVILAVILMILEIFAPGFILFPLGFAFLLSSGVAYFVDSAPVQLLTLAVSCGLTFWVGHRWLKPRQKINDHLLSGVDALVGQEGVVEEEINYEHNTGYVKIYGDSWRARSVNQETIPAGSRVVVERMESSQVIVRLKV